MTKPNTFIVGAPKCGTTALCHYLGLHPNVFMCDPKEPHFFAHKDMPGRKHYYKNLDEYLKLFRGVNPTETVVVEGSVWYLYADNALENIYRFAPDARIIVMLRRPDEMVYSYHKQALVSFNEDVSDFEKAWHISTQPDRPRTVPNMCDEPKVLQYGEIAKYGKQLTQLFSIFPRGQILILLFEDLTSNTHGVYTNVLKFLDIPLIYPASFEKVNENKVIHNKFLGKLLTYPPATLVNISSKFKAALGIEKFNLRNRLLNAISSKQHRLPLSEVTRKSILAHYQSDIMKTQELLGRDLSHWLK